MLDLISAFFVFVGSTFILLASIGIARMPDVFTRMQPATKAAILGAGSLLMAVAVHFNELAVTARVLLIIGFIVLTAPVAAHAIAKAAYSSGTELWEGTITDEMDQSRSDDGEAPARDAG